MGLADPAFYPDEAYIVGVMDWFVEDCLAAWERSRSPAGGPDAALQRSQTGPAATRSARPRVYGKTLAERLRLLRFVAERVIPVANRGVPGFDTSGHSILWEQVHAEWKKENPNYRGSSKSLGRAYRRAKNNRRVCELYFDDEFRDWAAQAEALRPTLSRLEAAGLRPEDVFVKTIAGQSTRLLEDARRLLERAQALRRANEAEDIDSATRKRNEESAKGLEASAQALTRASQFPEWSGISMQLSPDAGRALARVITLKCGLAAEFVRWPRGTDFCTGPQCRRCRAGADLLGTGMIAREDLSAASAAEAVEKLRRDLRFTALLFGASRDQQTTDRQQGDP
jgi:hypothetical protein